ncbi:phage tail protein [Mucilaginibacter xinganensis]|uniref:Microcystin-dependent protein n=1 Tax=Mucilaginibacter xinganensis TaxID=1234841 RepID=A0A223NX64_9SPHI|nr:tail fiber protein [Mucilaginibacter xinganensis]ASU34284.1 Microcystin-dependent protein [Mucilaginibacter xinganensis]
MDPYLGCVIIFAGNFEIRGFRFCSGQLLPISQNTALFSLLGTYYGGNGTSNFALPDLRGRGAIGQGPGPGLTEYVIGESAGEESVTLLSGNIPVHTHLVNAFNGSTVATASNSPANAFFAEGPKAGGISGKAPNYYLTPGVPNVTLNPLAVGVNPGGGSIPVPVMQPFLAVTHLIAMNGIFPPRN